MRHHGKPAVAGVFPANSQGRRTVSREYPVAVGDEATHLARPLGTAVLFAHGLRQSVDNNTASSLRLRAGSKG